MIQYFGPILDLVARAILTFLLHWKVGAEQVTRSRELLLTVVRKQRPP
jgi:hypothetical protein